MFTNQNVTHSGLPYSISPPIGNAIPSEMYDLVKKYSVAIVIMYKLVEGISLPD